MNYQCCWSQYHVLHQIAAAQGWGAWQAQISVAYLLLLPLSMLHGKELTKTRVSNHWRQWCTMGFWGSGVVPNSLSHRLICHYFAYFSELRRPAGNGVGMKPSRNCRRKRLASKSYGSLVYEDPGTKKICRIDRYMVRWIDGYMDRAINRWIDG